MARWSVWILVSRKPGSRRPRRVTVRTGPPGGDRTVWAIAVFFGIAFIVGGIMEFAVAAVARAGSGCMS